MSGRFGEIDSLPTGPVLRRTSCDSKTMAGSTVKQDSQAGMRKAVLRTWLCKDMSYAPVIQPLNGKLPI